MLYVITDTHLGHKNMMRSCGRPEGFTNLIIKNCQKKLKPQDTLIHLGDITWERPAFERFMEIPCTKILIRGNHDKMTPEQYMDAGFLFVAEEMTLDLHGIRVLFSHRPKYGHNADINIHGHLHNLHRDDIYRLYWPLSLEHMGYRPIALNNDVLRTLNSWVARKHVPSMEELIEFRQGYIGEARAVDYLGSDINNELGRPLKVYGDNGDTIELIRDDMLRFRYRGDVIFMAMSKEIYEAKLGDKKIAALLLPWNAPQFEEPRQVTEVKSDCIQKNIPPLENGVVRMWLKLGNF